MFVILVEVSVSVDTAVVSLSLPRTGSKKRPYRVGKVLRGSPGRRDPSVEETTKMESTNKNYK